MKEVLEKSQIRYFSQKEEDTFVKLFKKYGKNYNLIKAAFPTRTLKQVRHFSYGLYVRITKDPKHIHSALKKSLKPTGPVNYTEKENKVLLKGL